MLFSKIFLIKLEICLLAYSLFKLLLHSLTKCVAYFKRNGKIEDFIELLILSQMKFENIFEFFLIILVAILNTEIPYSVSTNQFLFQFALD